MGVVGSSPFAVGDDALWRFLLHFTKFDEEAQCNDFGITHYIGATEVWIESDQSSIHGHLR